MPNSTNISKLSGQQDSASKGYDSQMLDLPAKIKKLLLMLVKAAMIAFFLVGICTYVYFCPPVLTALNGGFILFPLPPGEEYKYDTINNVKREEVFFKNPVGNKLHGWYFQSPQAQAPVILISHGNAGNIGHRLLLVLHLMNAGASVFLFDYREYGQSEGKKSLSGIVDDSQAAYDYLTSKRKIPPASIVLYGESIGGGPTCILAERHPNTAGIILDSCFTSLLAVGKKKIAVFKIYPDFLQPIPALDNLSVLRGKHAPLLIMHGQQDDTIPLSEAMENYAGASQPKTLLQLPNSSHNSKDKDFELYESGVRKFLDSIKVTGT